MKHFSVIILMFFCFDCLQAQIQYPGKPLPTDKYSLDEVPVLLPQCDMRAPGISEEKIRHPLLKTGDDNLFCNVNLDYQSFGIWRVLPDGLRVWRAGVRVTNAQSMGIVFSRFRLEKGVRLFLYDNLQKQVFGAYTYKNNKISGSLATSVIHSNLVYIEMQVMPFVKNPGELMLEYVACKPKTIKTTEALQDSFYKASDWCNKDIGCYKNTNIQTAKNAVVRIIYDGVERCTGTLINTTRENGHPFLLTAGHCINNQRRAGNAVFYFQYESPSCYGSDGNSSFSVSGSTLLATASNLDFALLELSEKPPYYYHPYFAGWDSRNEPPESSYTIHHPLGDVKKISIENQQAETGDFSSEYLSNTHWLVSRWDVGTTEQGSSGCALFNNNHRVVGTLTGGWANCQESVNDYFQKLFHCWDNNSQPSGQLKFWLDPMQTGEEYIDGYDPFRNFWISGDTLSNTETDNTSVLFKGSQDWGYATGHSSDSVTMFAEKFVTGLPKNILGIMLNPGIVYPANDSSKVTLFISKDSPDGEVIFQTDVLLLDMIADDYFTIQMDEPVSITGDFYVGYRIFYQPAGDTFAVKLNTGNISTTENKAFIHADAAWYPLNAYIGTDQPVSLDISVLIYDSVPRYPGPDILPEENEILIYPNPAFNRTTIIFWELPKYDVKISLYNISGQLIKSELYKSPDVQIEYHLDNLSSGLYFIRMNVNNFIIVKKIMILSNHE